MARPSRNGTYNGEKDGFYTWNGFMWVDSRVTSFNNGNGGLTFVGDLGIGDIGDFGDFKLDLGDLNFDFPPLDIPFTLNFTTNPTHKKGIQFLSTAFDNESLDYLINTISVQKLKISSNQKLS